MPESALQTDHGAWRTAAWYPSWAAVWLAAFGLYQLVLTPAGYGLFGESWLSGGFFLLAAWAVLRAFRVPLRADLARPAPRALGILALCGALLVACCLLCATFWPVSAAGWQQFARLQIGIVRMDAVYFTAKLPELLFQQSMILVLVRRLQSSAGGLRGVLSGFALLFGAIHLPLLVLKGLAGLPYVLAAALLGCVFPLCIVRWRQGWLYAYCAHLLGYLVVGTGMRAFGV